MAKGQLPQQAVDHIVQHAPVDKLPSQIQNSLANHVVVDHAGVYEATSGVDYFELDYNKIPVGGAGFEIDGFDPNHDKIEFTHVPANMLNVVDEHLLGNSYEFFVSENLPARGYGFNMFDSSTSSTGNTLLLLDIYQSGVGVLSGSVPLTGYTYEDVSTFITNNVILTSGDFHL